MAEQQLRQDKHGCYYWADPEPEPEQTVAPVESATVLVSAEPTVVPTVAPAKRTRGPRKAAPAPAPATDSVIIPPPPPIIRG